MRTDELISIIIRTKDEERWITQCLTSVFNQTYKHIEVILVDNESEDGTLEKAKKFPLKKVVKCKKFRPGKALNMGIRKSKGKLIVCLSGHCIPVNDQWLENLRRNFESDKVAGVYGRQEPLAISSDADKRDLLTIFGLDRKVQKKDSFFHNANSMIRRDLWEECPFDEDVTNIEDRVWAHEILQKGYEIIYEPEASVYHYHGIHQNGDEERCYNVVRIVEKLLFKDKGRPKFSDPKKLEIVAAIPVKGESVSLGGRSLLEHSIEQAKKSRYIDKVVVLTDSRKSAAVAKKSGAEVPFLRDAFLSEDYIDLEKVYTYSLQKLEDLGVSPDIFVTLEPTFPFRRAGLIDEMIEKYLEGGFDSMLAVKEENKSIWKKQKGEINRLDDGFTPRKYKEPTFLGLRGLCCLTRPVYLREGFFYGNNVGLFEVDDTFAGIEIRNEKDAAMAEPFMEMFIKDNKRKGKKSHAGR